MVATPGNWESFKDGVEKETDSKRIVLEWNEQMVFGSVGLGDHTIGYEKQSVDDSESLCEEIMEANEAGEDIHDVFINYGFHEV